MLWSSRIWSFLDWTSVSRSCNFWDNFSNISLNLTPSRPATRTAKSSATSDRTPAFRATAWSVPSIDMSMDRSDWRPEKRYQFRKQYNASDSWFIGALRVYQKITRVSYTFYSYKFSASLFLNCKIIFLCVFFYIKVYVHVCYKPNVYFVRLWTY